MYVEKEMRDREVDDENGIPMQHERAHVKVERKSGCTLGRCCAASSLCSFSIQSRAQRARAHSFRSLFISARACVRTSAAFVRARGACNIVSRFLPRVIHATRRREIAPRHCTYRCVTPSSCKYHRTHCKYIIRPSRVSSINVIVVSFFFLYFYFFLFFFIVAITWSRLPRSMLIPCM